MLSLLSGFLFFLVISVSIAMILYHEVIPLNVSENFLQWDFLHTHLNRSSVLQHEKYIWCGVAGTLVIIMLLKIIQGRSMTYSY